MGVSADFSGAAGHAERGNVGADLSGCGYSGGFLAGRRAGLGGRSGARRGRRRCGVGDWGTGEPDQSGYCQTSGRPVGLLRGEQLPDAGGGYLPSRPGGGNVTGEEGFRPAQPGRDRAVTGGSGAGEYPPEYLLPESIPRFTGFLCSHPGFPGPGGVLPAGHSDQFAVR